ncbi:hypothetical protein QTP86_012685 [Hemibagrus guttatus]|nr:hypothetical protein QTP86_012685 [Hemibagrus guttatus]
MNCGSCHKVTAVFNGKHGKHIRHDIKLGAKFGRDDPPSEIQIHDIRIHASDEYVMDRATVFHSTYLSTCRLRQSTKSVPLGHYLLPPLSVQREVKARIGRFIWEQNEMLGVTHQLDAKGSQSEKEKKRQENTSPSREESVCCEAQLYPVNNMLSGYVHIDQLKKFSGELHDFLPSHSGYSVSRSHSRSLPYHSKERL